MLLLIITIIIYVPRPVQPNPHNFTGFVVADMSVEQAQVLAELFSGRTGLLSQSVPCNIAELQAYYSRSHPFHRQLEPNVIHLVLSFPCMRHRPLQFACVCAVGTTCTSYEVMVRVQQAEGRPVSCDTMQVHTQFHAHVGTISVVCMAVCFLHCQYSALAQIPGACDSCDTHLTQNDLGTHVLHAEVWHAEQALH